MAECPNREKTASGHCWHPMTAPYSVARSQTDLTPAIGECCCFCGAAHVKILMDAPPDAADHGEYLVFQSPAPRQAPPPIVLPTRPRIVH